MRAVTAMLAVLVACSSSRPSVPARLSPPTRPLESVRAKASPVGPPPPPAAHEWAPAERASAPAGTGSASPAPSAAAIPPLFRRANAVVVGCGSADSESESVALPHDHGDGVVVYSSPAGLEIHHAFEHLCCMQAHASIAQAGPEIHVTERISGKGCKCKCRSEVVVTLPITPGRHRVWIRGAGQTAFDETVTVPADSHERVPLAGHQRPDVTGTPAL